MTYAPGTPDGPVRVALVDDQPLVRAGLRMVIESQPDLQVVVEADDGRDALRLLATTASDVVLMDVRMPGMDGLSATRALLADGKGSREDPQRSTDSTGRGGYVAAGDPRVVVLTTFDLDEYVLDAIRAGASGFLLKDAQPEELLTAIRTVHKGDAVIAPSSTRRLMERLVTTLPPDEATGPQEALAGLTVREREVLVLMARGRSNTEIAADLFVAEATVKTHVGRILSKLDARDRVQAVVTAYETGLVRPGS